jgi:hypothetical protein
MVSPQQINEVYAEADHTVSSFASSHSSFLNTPLQRRTPLNSLHACHPSTRLGPLARQHRPFTPTRRSTHSCCHCQTYVFPPPVCHRQISDRVLIRSNSCAVRAWGSGVCEIPPCRTSLSHFISFLTHLTANGGTGRPCVAAALESIDYGASDGGMSDGCPSGVLGGTFVFALLQMSLMDLLLASGR